MYNEHVHFFKSLNGWMVLKGMGAQSRRQTVYPLCILVDVVWQKIVCTIRLTDLQIAMTFSDSFKNASIDRIRKLFRTHKMVAKDRPREIYDVNVCHLFKWIWKANHSFDQRHRRFCNQICGIYMQILAQKFTDHTSDDQKQIDLERQENMRTNFSQSTSISLYIIYK